MVGLQEVQSRCRGLERWQGLGLKKRNIYKGNLQNPGGNLSINYIVKYYCIQIKFLKW